MCLAFPGKIINVEGRLATIQYPQEQRQAMIAEEGVEVGDWVMVQMGMVIQKLSQEEAAERNLETVSG